MPRNIILLHMCNLNEDHMMYGSWDIRHDRQFFCHFVPFFFPFDPPNNPMNQNFAKMKTMPGDIILHMCTINDNHKIYGSWDMERDREFVILDDFFALLPPLTTRKIKFLKKWKKKKKKP